MIDLPPWILLLPWILAGCAVLIALSTIPLAVRRADERVWRLHAAIAVAWGIGFGVFVHVTFYHLIIPWWRTIAGAFVELVVPTLVAAYVARTASERWPSRRRLATSLAVLATLVLVGGFGVRVAGGLMPEFDMINAVQ